MYVNNLHVDEALNLEDRVFVDVRSRAEYEEAHIPGAINIPLLENDERAEVGTLYKQVSQQSATIAGLKYVGEKLPHIYEQLLKLREEYRSIVFYCWRGGMRSESIVSLMTSLKFKGVYKLSGGYKGYRKFVNGYLNNQIDKKFVVLHGHTGVGKTLILDRLSKNGLSVINLEELANNSGSVFGDIMFKGKTPSQKQFDSYMFNTLYYNDKPYIILESESKRVGGINLPDAFMKKMLEGVHILVETSIPNRIENCYNDYIDDTPNLNESLINAISHLKKRLGNDNVIMLTNAVNEGDYRMVIEFLIKNYYDSLYSYSIEKYRPYDLVIDYKTVDEAIEEVERYISTNFNE